MLDDHYSDRHICYLANATSIHTRRWANYFAEHGWKVDLITWHPPGKDAEINANIDVHRILFPPHYIARYGALLEIALLINKIRPDIIHAHYISHFGILAGLYWCLSGFRPIVLTAWGSDVWIDAKGWKKRLIKYALKKADAVTTTSPQLREDLIATFGVPKDKIEAFPWGIDLEVFHVGYETAARKLRQKLAIGEDAFVVLSPRNMVPHYRIDHIVQAMPMVVDKHPNIILILLKGASRGETYLKRIAHLAANLGIGQNLRVVKQELNPTEMSVAYNISDAFVSIPKSDQFASCIMEGMACGVIPIVGDLEVYHQYLVDGKNALFVNPEDPEQIARKIIHCLEHPEVHERFYAINRKIIEEKEDWSKNAQKMEELYLNLLDLKQSAM